MEYNTRQKQAVADLLKEAHGTHMTVDEAVRKLEAQGIRIGNTTVYRTLEQLVRNGNARKYVTGSSPACYQWADECNHEHCYHLVCTECGKLQHMNCKETDELFEHIFKEHHFAPDMSRTVLYGICAECAEKKENR